MVLDGPDADTETLVDGLVNNDSRLRLERVERDPEGLERGGQAREKGVRLATSEVVLALDDDVVPQRGLVSGHAARHAAEADVVVLGFMPVISVAGSESDVTARIYGASYERACRRYQNDPGAILEGLWGGNLSIRRRDWLKAMEQPRVAAGYHADLELGLLLKRAGLRGLFDPQLQADHVYRRSRRDFVRDAKSSGVGRARVLMAHPELTETHREHRVGARVLRVAAVTGGWPLGREVLLALASTASFLRMRALERAAMLLLWQLGVIRGMHRARCFDAEHG